ncbi:MAG: response regulator [Candidatus Acidiferrales bacterium]
MPKILVADDNSNIQKMVTLALAEHHMEVVAVGNGEVAVRRLPDVKPDLILADVFMPVRNGYEVCEFVKNDPQFAHIPVILLVGAFDPLDEKEAHRVCADGILKKPFVPPDPLIAMVVSTLERCKNANMAARQAEAAAAAAAAPPPVKQVDIPLPPPPTVLFAQPDSSGAEESHPLGPGRAESAESQDQQMGLDTMPSWRRRALNLQVPDGISSAAFEASVSESDSSSSGDDETSVAAPEVLGTSLHDAGATEFHAAFPETASIGAVESAAQLASDAAAPEMAAAAPANWPELPAVAPVAHQAATPTPEHVAPSTNDSSGAGWMNVVTPAPPVKNPSGWTVMLDSPAGSVPSVPYRHVPRNPSGVEASAGLSVTPLETAKALTPPTDSSIAAEMSRLFSGLVSPEAAAVAADAAAIEAATPVSSSPARSENTASEVSQAVPEAAAEAPSEAQPSRLQLEGDESSSSGYEAVQSVADIGEVEGPSVTGVENEPGGSLVTPIEALTDESSDSQYTIGPTQLEVDDSVATNFAGSQAPDLHSPLETAPEPPPKVHVETELHANAEVAPAPAAAAPLAAHLDIDAAVMEAAVKRVLERLEPHLHEILSNGVLRPLIENALQKELEQK